MNDPKVLLAKGTDFVGPPRSLGLGAEVGLVGGR